MSKPVLVVGAAGAFGNAACDAFARAGHRVRGLVRASSAVDSLPDAVEVVVGDAQDRFSLERAAEGEGQELERRTMFLTSLLEPLLILSMGVVVLLIVLAVLMPIIEINQLVR